MRFLALAVLTSVAFTGDEDLFPLSEGAVWTFAEDGGQEKQVEVLSVEEEEGEKVFRLKSFTQLFDELDVVVRAGGVFLIREAGVEGVDGEEALQILKFPMTKDETWGGAWKVGGEEVDVECQNLGEEALEVPAGKYDTWKMKMSFGGKAGLTVELNCARGVGPVRMSFSTKYGSQELTLKSYDAESGKTDTDTDKKEEDKKKE